MSAPPDLATSLERYRTGRFTDTDVMLATELTERAWRELLKSGSVKTLPPSGGRGHVRKCDSSTLKRAALLSVMHQARLSLATSAKLLTAWPSDPEHFYLIDPVHEFDADGVWTSAAPASPATGWPCPARFNPAEPARAEAHADWLLQIANGRFIAATILGEDRRLVFGEFRDEVTFVRWFPTHASLGLSTLKRARSPEPFEEMRDRVIKYSDLDFAKRHLPATFVRMDFEPHNAVDDPARLAAESAFRDPQSLLTVNLTLAVVIGLRRFLGIELADAKARAPST